MLLSSSAREPDGDKQQQAFEWREGALAQSKAMNQRPKVLFSDYVVLLKYWNDDSVEFLHLNIKKEKKKNSTVV